MRVIENRKTRRLTLKPVLEEHVLINRLLKKGRAIIKFDYDGRSYWGTLKFLRDGRQPR